MEQKARQNYNSWHYYVENIIIGKKKFLLEFDVVSRNDGENHYRIQRLVPLDYEKNKSPNSSISSKTMGTASVRPVSTKDNTTIQKKNQYFYNKIFIIKLIIVNLPLLYLLHEINISVLKKIPTKHIKVYSLYLYIINMADILLLDLRLITTL